MPAAVSSKMLGSVKALPLQQADDVDEKVTSVASTACSDSSGDAGEETAQSVSTSQQESEDSDTSMPESDEEEVPQQLQPGPPPPPASTGGCSSLPSPPPREPSAPSCDAGAEGEAPVTPFAYEETLFVFDWDDTVLPSTWLQQNGLRLDAGSQPTLQQKEILARVAAAAGRTLRAARQHGTVVLVTNAERGWIELSCQKFLPMLAPMLENVKLVSARTTYDSAQCSSPLQWKLCAFAVEITEHFGFDVMKDPDMRKNILSLGDSLHEREALQVATAPLPNCSSKSMKFVERPDIAQICKQHELIFKSFERVVHHGGDLDLCIRCP